MDFRNEDRVDTAPVTSAEAEDALFPARYEPPTVSMFSGEELASDAARIDAETGLGP